MTVQDKIDEFTAKVASGRADTAMIAGHRITTKYAYRRTWFYLDGESVSPENIAEEIASLNEQDD